MFTFVFTNNSCCSDFFKDYGPPERVICLGEMAHTCQEDLVLKVTQTDVPYFNAPIYLENKEQVRLESRGSNDQNFRSSNAVY